MADHTLDMEPKRPVVLIGAFVGVGRHPAHDESGICLRDLLIRDSQLLHGLGGIVLHDHVRYGNQVHQRFLALWL